MQFDKIAHLIKKMAKNADDERIKTIVQRAIGITKNIEDPYRLKAFEIVLSKLLSDNVTGKSTEKRLELKLPAGTKKGDAPL
jgi:hypothetical protein